MAAHKKKKKYENRLSVRKLDAAGRPLKTPDKPGKVVRVPEDVWEVLQSVRKPRESVAKLLKRLMKDDAEIMYMLPESMMVFRTEAEAKGKAIVMAVVKSRKAGKKSPPESVVPVRVPR
jgi:predicted CopG family antitoxin